MTLGDIIKKYRVDNHMSLRDFADKSGISRAYVSVLERNRHPMTGEPIAPSVETIKQAAGAMNIDFNALFSMIDSDVSLTSLEASDKKPSPDKRTTIIPVLGSVPAGPPIEAIEDIIDWEDIPLEWLAGGKEYFGLRVRGDSMFPRYVEGDTVIVRKSDTCDSGQDCVVYVNGDYEATLKKVLLKPNCIILQPYNNAYEPMVFDFDEGECAVKIAGVVVELRRKMI